MAWLLNALCNLFFWLSVRFGSRAWGGVDGAYRHGRILREREYCAWLAADQRAKASNRLGDLDDCATAIISGNQRYEIEECHVRESLETAIRKLGQQEYSDAEAILRSITYILDHGKPEHDVTTSGD
jgi:hypothetical protein